MQTPSAGELSRRAQARSTVLRSHGQAPSGRMTLLEQALRIGLMIIAVAVIAAVGLLALGGHA